MEHLNYIAQLIKEYQENSLDKTGQQQLNNWLSSDDRNRDLFERLNKNSELISELKEFYAAPVESIWATLTADLTSNTNSATHRIHFKRTSWLRYAAAIIIMLGVAGYLWFNNTTSNPINSTNPTNPNSDISPGNNKAILTLADGREIRLDSTQGSIAQQGSLKIINQQGKLDYEGLSSVTEYHTLSTPKGGQYKIQLPDGTNVWLNAASSITYPTAFAGKERKVTITGEAYFEVTKDAHKPFTVKTYKDEIVVLGTAFNINSYKEELTVRTSLLEGSVLVNNQPLKPGEAYKDGKVFQTNTEQDIAWKNGLFNFNHLTLEEAMNQLARWYDLEIVYEGKFPAFNFYGEMGRDLSLNQVLKVLSGMGVNFKITEGRKLIVSVK